MADSKISGLVEATSVNDSDLETIVQGGVNKKIQSVNSLKKILNDRGVVAIDTDFPTLAAVQVGWLYRFSAAVTDNNATKTNTGQSFIIGDEAYWNGNNWEILGKAEAVLAQYNSEGYADGKFYPKGNHTSQTITVAGSDNQLKQATTTLNESVSNQITITNGTGSLEVSGTSKVNQDLKTTASPTHVGLTLSGLNTANGIVQTNSSGALSTSTALPNGTTATTQSVNNNSTSIATTAYADRLGAPYEASNGWISGGVLSGTLGGTAFDVSAITARFVDYTTESAPVPTAPITFGAQTNISVVSTLVNLISVYINSAGVISQYADDTDWSKLYVDKIFLGNIVLSGGVIVAFSNIKFPAADRDNLTFFQFNNIFAPINLGLNKVGVSATDLSITISDGEIWEQAANITVDRTNPNVLTFTAVTAPDLVGVWANTAGEIQSETASSQIDINHYNPNGTGSALVAVTAGYYVNFPIMYNASTGLLGYQYPTSQYATQSESLAAVGKFVRLTSADQLKNFNVFGYITVQQGSINFSTAVTASGEIFNYSIGGNTGSAGGGDVLSVFGRTGNVVATTGDYKATQIDEVVTQELWLDCNRVDAYTADGSNSKPFATFSAVVAAMTSSVVEGYALHIVSGTYSEASAVTMPNKPITIYGNSAIITFTAGLTFPNPTYTIYDLNIIGNVTMSGTSSTGHMISQGGSITGNLTINGGIGNYRATQLIGGLVTVTSPSTTIFNVCTMTSQITGNGIIIVENCQQNTGKSTPLITSLTGGTLFTVNCLITNTGTGGGISCDNGANGTTRVNGISNCIITTASGATIACGTSVTILAKSTVSGTPTGTGYIGSNFDVIGGGTVMGVGSDATGDMYYRAATALLTRIAPNTSTTKNFLSMTGTGTAGGAPAWGAITSSDVGLGNVTNDAQTKVAIVPNAAPSAGQILVGNAGGTAYAPETMSGDATLASTGAITIANNSVTNAKAAQASANTYKGNSTGSTANVSDVSTNTAFNQSFETSTANIKMDGTASVGALSTIARADHIHPTDTSRQPVITQGNLSETTSSVLTITGGTSAVIGSGATIQVTKADSSNSGYLSSTDWNSFNNNVGSSGSLPNCDDGSIAS